MSHSRRQSRPPPKDPFSARFFLGGAIVSACLFRFSGHTLVPQRGSQVRSDQFQFAVLLS